MRKVFEIALGVIFGALVGLLIGGLLYLTTRAPSGQKVELMPSSTPEPVSVYITGAVERPGVYQVPRDSRLVEVIALAGGFLEGAEIDKLNLAEKVTDGQQINIPGNVEIPTPQLVIGGGGLLVTPTPPVGGLVNINTADAALLETIPGVGPTIASRIIAYREENGPFERVDDLTKVAGIGPATLEKIKPYVTVE
jgi:competence protein ComEA